MSGSLARQIVEEVAEPPASAKAWPALVKRASLLLEEEHYYELSAPVGPFDSAVVAPWREAEEAFSAGRDRLALPAEPDVADFLARNGAARLAYGYPTLAWDGALAPLFSVKARLAADGAALLLERPETARLNLLALRRGGLAEADALRLANELSDARLDFAERLARALRALGLDPAGFQPQRLAPLTDADRPRWINCPILFAAPFSPERRAVWNDLVALLKRAPSGAGVRTALAGLFEPPPERKAPLTFELHALGPSQSEAVRAAMRQDVAVIEAAPGAGQMATVANLIATATAAGERVLYVAARAEAANVMARHVESLIARDRRLVVQLNGKLGAERDALVDSLYRLARDEATREPPAGQEKPQREKPTRKSLAELDRFAPKVEPVAVAVRQAHEHIRERHLLQLALAAELGPDWTGPQGRRAPIPATREQLAAWRAQLSEGGARASGGLTKLVKNMLGGKEETDLVAAVRAAAAKAPAGARAQLAALLVDGSDLASVRRAVEQIARFCEWRAALQARNDAIRKLARHHPDSRSLELQAMNHGAQKSSGAREIFRDEWLERVAADPLTLQKQVKVLFDLFERGAEQPDARAEGQASVRLAQAVQVVSSTLRLWTATPAQALKLLPLEPGLFDLVVLDEADRMDLGAALPLLYRGRRAAIVGASRGERRRCVAPPRRSVALARSVPDAPAWSEDAARSLLAQAGDALREQGVETCRLTDHFRSHPFIAALLSRTFYGDALKVRTNYRNLRRDAPEEMLGVRWRHVDGRLEASEAGPLNAAEVEAAAALVEGWRKAGVLSRAPRRSFAIVTPFPAEARALAARLARLDLPAERLWIGVPEDLAGRVVDYLVLLPGLCPGTPEPLRARLAESEALYHDALGAVRLGLHVVGDRSACLEAGGHAAALALWAGAPVSEPADAPAAESSWFDPRFDEAFGPLDGAKPDAAAPLAKMLSECGFAYQMNVEEGGLRFAYRVLTPHGGRYDVEIDPTLEELAARPGELERLAERDKAAAAMGYQVVRFGPDELLSGGELVLERLQRLM